MSILRKNILLFVTAWLFASGLGIYLRLYTYRHNVTHESEEKAAILVLNNLRKTIYQNVDLTNPSLSTLQKEKIAKEQFSQVLHNDSAKVRQSIEQASQQLDKKFSPTEKPFYLLASDSYYYYNLTENILKTGKISNQFQGSKYFNPLMNAPHGYWEPLKLYPYIGYFTYKLTSFFKPKISLMEAVSFTPLLLLIFIVLIFLLNCYILNCNAATSFLGAIAFLCAPIFLRRSMFGWYDDDPPNILFLFTILTVFFYGLKNLKQQKTTFICALTCSALFMLYALFWQGWVFLASIIAVSAFVIVLYDRIIHRHKAHTSALLLYFSLVIAGTFLGICIIFGPKEFFSLFKEGWTALEDFLNPQLSLWPDLYIAVGELLSPTPIKWLEMMGGIFFISIGTLGLLSRSLKLLKKPNDTGNFATILLVIFSVTGIKLSFGAQRFETLCLIPFSFAFPLGLQFLWDNFKKATNRHIPALNNSVLGQSIMIISLLTLLTVLPFQAAQKITPEILNKIFNSTWDTALTKIKNETPANSIINTWWSPGHFIKAIAHRRVIFDGATINKPQSYWLANAFLATDEKTAAGILRMINNSGNDASDYLLGQGFPLSQATKLLKTILALDQEHARRALNGILKQEQIEKLLKLTHAAPPPAYLLLYNEMADSNIQFSFVGNWDFEKVARINNDPNLRSRVPKKSSKEYVPFLWRLAGNPPRYSETLQSLYKKDGTIIFENNVYIDLNTVTCTINSAKFGKGIPQSVLYEQSGMFIEKKLVNANLPYSVMLIMDGPDTKCILAETSLAHSILLRLYFYGGKGLQIFEPFSDERDTTGRTHILVYKINWEKL